MLDPNILSIVAVVISIIAIFAPVISSRRERILADENAKNETVIQFTFRFLDLLDEGIPNTENQNSSWWSKYWNLLGTEFFFFHYGKIEPKIFFLWITDLVELFAEDEGFILESFNDSLGYYDEYKEMFDFFQEIKNIGKNYDFHQARRARTKEYVMNWHKEEKLKNINKRNSK